MLLDEDLVLDSERGGEKYIQFLLGGMGLTLTDKYNPTLESLDLFALPTIELLEILSDRCTDSVFGSFRLSNLTS